MFERILVPVDGSGLSALALDHALELARATNAAITVLHVVPDPELPPAIFDGPPIDSSAVRRDLRREGEGIARAALGRLLYPQARARVESAAGRRVADVIAAVAEDERSDLIVMGTHGRAGLERLLLGSVAEGVAHVAKPPVLLVRAPRAARGAGRVTNRAAPRA